MPSAFTRRAAAVALLLAPAAAFAQPTGQPARNRQPAGDRPAADRPAAEPAASGQAEFKTFEEKLSYVLGVNTARSMRNDNVNPDPRLFARGFVDELTEGKSLLSDEEMTQVLQQFRERIQAQAEEARRKLAESWNQTFQGDPEGEAKTTKSGIKYEVFTQGEGPKPKPTDVVIVHYVGKFAEGEVFDSSVERGEPLPLSLSGQIIQGWKEALPLMPVGSRYRFHIPAALGYGEKGREPLIKPNQDLVFEIELLDIAPPEDQAGAGSAPPAPEGDAPEGTPAPPE